LRIVGRLAGILEDELDSPASRDQSEVIMDTCFFCNKAIENEDDYMLIGLVQDEAAELVLAHQDCAGLRSDHVELFGLLESRPLGMG